MRTTLLDTSDAATHGLVGRDARNGLADCPPWLILFTGYLCISGFFGTLEILLELPTQTNLLWSIRNYFFASIVPGAIF